MIKYILPLFVVFAGTYGQIILKIEANRLLPTLPHIGSLGSLIAALLIFSRNIKILSVVFLYAFSFFTWLFVLARFELSYIFPITTALIYVLILLLSWLLLKENMTIFRIIGMVAITAGIILINVGK